MKESCYVVKDSDGGNQDESRGTKGSSNGDALVRAAEDGNIGALKILLQDPVGTPKRSQSEAGEALVVASRKGDIGAVSLILQERKNVDCINHQNKYGRTAMHYASQEGHTQVVNLHLQQSNVDINHEDGDGMTPLHDAAYRGHIEVVKLLLEQPSIDVNVRNKKGITPLWYASSRDGQVEIVNLLKASGGLMEIRRASGKNCVCARRTRRRDGRGSIRCAIS